MLRGCLQHMHSEIAVDGRDAFCPVRDVPVDWEGREYEQHRIQALRQIPEQKRLQERVVSPKANYEWLNQEHQGLWLSKQSFRFHESQHSLQGDQEKYNELCDSDERPIFPFALEDVKERVEQCYLKVLFGVAIGMMGQPMGNHPVFVRDERGIEGMFQDAVLMAVVVTYSQHEIQTVGIYQTHPDVEIVAQQDERQQPKHYDSVGYTIHLWGRIPRLSRWKQLQGLLSQGYKQSIVVVPEQPLSGFVCLPHVIFAQYLVDFLHVDVICLYVIGDVLTFSKFQPLFAPRMGFHERGEIVKLVMVLPQTRINSCLFIPPLQPSLCCFVPKHTKQAINWRMQYEENSIDYNVMQFSLIEDTLEDQILPVHKTVVVKPEKIEVNPQYSSVHVNDFLKKMIEKLHQKQMINAYSKDEMLRQKELLDLRKKLVNYSQKENTSNVLSLEYEEKNSRIRAPVLERVNFMNKYNAKVAIKVHTINQLQEIQKHRKLKQNWTKKCQAIFNSLNYKRMNHVLKRTQSIRPKSSCSFTPSKFSPLLQKPKSSYGPRSRLLQQRPKTSHKHTS